MKFGQHYYRLQVAQWAEHYVRYDTAKQLLRQIRGTNSDRVDEALLERLLAELNDVLTTDLNVVSDFYDCQLAKVLSRLSALRLLADDPSHASDSKYSDTQKCPDEVSSLLHKLYHRLWYGRVNAEAFESLVHKLERFQVSSSALSQKLRQAITTAPFAPQTQCLAAIRQADDCLRSISSQAGQSSQIASRSNLEGDEDVGSLDQKLHIALRNGAEASVKQLLTQGADSAFKNAVGETALYVAARTGRRSLVEALVQSPSFQKNHLHLVESQNAWTPLTVACLQGYLDIAKLLVHEDANTLAKDRRGWTAADHAAFRGHLRIAAWLTTIVHNHERDTNAISPSDTYTRHLTAAKDCKLEVPVALQARPESTIRRRCEEGEETSYIIIRLGPANTRSAAKPIEVCGKGWSGASIVVYPELGYALHVDAVGAIRPGQTVSLPLLRDGANDPIIFATTAPKEAQMTFTLRRVENMQTSEGPVIGAGVALLENLKKGYATGFEGLSRDFTVPILAKDTFEVLALVTFNHLLVTPTPTPKVTKASTLGFWKNDGTTKVVGHRGSGMNTAKRSNLQLEENTVQSMITAAALGASGVEFDVQLTKDLEPIIYHDFTVMEQGGDTPIHALQAQQFLQLSRAQAPQGDRAYQHPRPRSRSLDICEDQRSLDLYAKMRMTAEEIHGPLKGNVTGLAIQEVSAKFEDLLKDVPQDVAFDIEMKYPMLWEAEDRNMAPFSVEANTFVDRVLARVYALAGTRSIGFSSFSPEMCILLAIKQHDYPILFLSKAGSILVGDVRSGGVQQSIQFAKRWGLAGIVMLSEPFVMSPMLIAYAKSAGLVCCSYGDLNDEPENALVQTEAGLDVIIVNKVRLIAETLAAKDTA